MRPPMRGVVIFLALVLAGCAPRAEPQAVSNVSPAAQKVERTKFLAADVFEVDGETYRLAGVSVPQPYPKAKCWAEAALARRALQFVEGLQWGRWALIERDNINRVGEDPDGLTRAVVNVGEADDKGEPLLDDLGNRLVAAGLAAKWSATGFDWCSTTPDPKLEGSPALTGLS
jgi:hypothetical protein